MCFPIRLLAPGLLLSGLLLSGVVAAQTASATEWMIEAHYPDQAALAEAASHFQHVIVDAKRQVLRVDTDEAGIAILENAGLTVSVDEAATAHLRSFQATMQAAIDSGVRSVNGAGYPTIPGFACYRTVEGTYQTMDDLAAAHPDIVTIDDIGPTWLKTQNSANGYEMRALRITNLATAASDADRPKMVVFSSIHAREYAPAEIDTRFAEWLVNGYGADPEATWLVDHNDFRLVLQANPDGRKEAEQQIYWRKNVDDINGNCSFDSQSDGIDLNRNFPFHWNITHGGGSSGDKCDETFRGPVKQSEPETDNLVSYVAGTCNDAGECTGGLFADRRDGPMNPGSTSGDGGDAAPDDTTGFFVDVHSYAELILWPWGDTSSAAPNRNELRTLGRRIAWFNDYYPQQSDELYPTDGTTDDTMYGLLGVPAYTIETDTAFFEDCGTFDSRTASENINALRYAARTLYAPYKLPSGPDTTVVSANPDLVAAGEPANIIASVDDSRISNANGTEPVQNVASANAYVDMLPWEAGATPIALTASDGSFNSPTEQVEGQIPTSGLADGRYLVYVQGTDASTSAGTPNATFIEVAAADHIGTLYGTITANADDSPLAATVTVSNDATNEVRSTTSSATDGSYQRPMLAGSVDVHVHATGYLSEDLQGVVLPAGGDVQHDFSLLSNCTLLDEDVESGANGWSSQSPWTISSNVPGNATHVWNTPNYGDNQDRSLTSPTIDLTGYADAELSFDDRCATEPGYDYGYVEVSGDNGSNWTVVSSCNGRTSWQSNTVELPASLNDSANVKIRFRLHTDPGVNAAGWAVDNMHVEAGGDACRAQQQPNDTIFDDGFDG